MKRDKSKQVKSKRAKHKQQIRKKIVIDQRKLGRSLMMLRGDRTQTELAQALNISDSAIRMYESGSRIPEDNIKLAYSKFFQKTVDELFFAYVIVNHGEDDKENRVSVIRAGQNKNRHQATAREDYHHV